MDINTINIQEQLGEFAFKRLQILSALKAQRNVDSLKEQLKEQLHNLEKQMVLSGWNGKEHTVIMTPTGVRLKQ